jgi:hypothetical protein
MTASAAFDIDAVQCRSMQCHRARRLARGKSAGRIATIVTKGGCGTKNDNQSSTSRNIRREANPALVLRLKS